MRLRLKLAAVIAVLGTAGIATAASNHEGGSSFRAKLTGYEETPTLSTSATGTFQATLTFPSSLSTPGSKHRVLFREYEIFAADAEDGVRDGVGVVQVGAATTSYKARIVYVDAVTINI